MQVRVEVTNKRWWSWRVPLDKSISSHGYLKTQRATELRLGVMAEMGELRYPDSGRNGRQWR